MPIAKKLLTSGRVDRAACLQTNLKVIATSKGKGGSRRPGAIFQRGNRDGDIAIHPKTKRSKLKSKTLPSAGQETDAAAATSRTAVRDHQTGKARRIQRRTSERGTLAGVINPGTRAVSMASVRHPSSAGSSVA